MIQGGFIFTPTEKILRNMLAKQEGKTLVIDGKREKDILEAKGFLEMLLRVMDGMVSSMKLFLVQLAN